MLTAAPYMNTPLPIMIPIYKWWEVGAVACLPACLPACPVLFPFPHPRPAQILSDGRLLLQHQHPQIPQKMDTQLPYFWAGAKAYDLVAATRQKSVPSSHYMDACVILISILICLGVCPVHAFPWSQKRPKRSARPTPSQTTHPQQHQHQPKPATRPPSSSPCSGPRGSRGPLSTTTGR